MGKGLIDQFMLTYQQGSGKTLIAAHIVRNCLKEIRSVTQGTEDESKLRLIAFLAPTKILVGQQLRYFSKHTDAKLIEFTGETSTLDGKSLKYWLNQGWKLAFRNAEVIFMTPQIMKQMLEKKLLQIQDFHLIIVDECHHAFGHDPVTYIIEKVREETDPLKAPKIFAMTASPLMCKRGTIEDNLARLQYNLHSRIFFSKDILEEYHQFTPIASLDVFRYEMDNTSLSTECELENFLLNDPTHSYSSSFSEALKEKDFCSIALHVYSRAKHAALVCSLYSLLDKMHTDIDDICQLPFAHELPSIAVFRAMKKNPQPDFQLMIPFNRNNTLLQNPTKYLFTRAFKATTSIGEVAQVIRQVIKVSDECGLLCGLYSLMSCLKTNMHVAKNKSKELNTSSLHTVKTDNNHKGIVHSRFSSMTKKWSRFSSNASSGKNSTFPGEILKQKKKRKVTTASIGAFQITDSDKIDKVVMELSNCKYPIIDLFNEDYVACTCVLDLFVSIISQLSLSTIRRGSRKYLSSHNRQSRRHAVEVEISASESYRAGDDLFPGCDDSRTVFVQPIHAVVYYIMQFLLTPGNISLEWSSEGCLKAISNRIMPNKIRHDDGSVNFSNNVVLRYKDLRYALHSAIWEVITCISLDELKIWAKTDFGLLGTDLEPLQISKRNDAAAVEDDQLEDEKLPDLVPKFDRTTRLPIISNKVKALCKLWSTVVCQDNGYTGDSSSERVSAIDCIFQSPILQYGDMSDNSLGYQTLQTSLTTYHTTSTLTNEPERFSTAVSPRNPGAGGIDTGKLQ